jgi:RHS repeat-associated protein
MGCSAYICYPVFEPQKKRFKKELTLQKTTLKARSVYLYGFNGKETDKETDLQDYGMRIYNPSLGRFLSVDPLKKSYPWYTPYQFAGNKPIAAIDLDGLEEYFVTDVIYKGVSQRYVTLNPNATEADKGVYQYTFLNGTQYTGAAISPADQNLAQALKSGAYGSDAERLYQIGIGRVISPAESALPPPPPPPPAPPPAPVHKPGDKVEATPFDIPMVVSTSGATGGSIKDPYKPGYDGELATEAVDYFKKIGSDVAKNPGKVKEINVLIHYNVGADYKGVWPPVGITQGGPTAVKEVTNAVKSGLKGANVKVNVTYEYSNRPAGNSGVGLDGATVEYK